MAGVLAQADVSDQRERQLLGPQETERLRHRATFGGGPMPLIVLAIGDAKQEHATDALRCEPMRFGHGEVGAQARVALERLDLDATVPS